MCAEVPLIFSIEAACESPIAKPVKIRYDTS